MLDIHVTDNQNILVEVSDVIRQKLFFKKVCFAYFFGKCTGLHRRGEAAAGDLP